MGIILEGNFINIMSSDNSLERNEKESQYIDYIETHRENVKDAYYEYFEWLKNEELDLKSCSNEEFKEALNTCLDNIEIHDESKYSDAEFTPYREKFYPTEDEKVLFQNAEYETQRQEDFLSAWIHHYKNNPHHPEYWIQENGDTLDMELRYIIEMLCDWLSFGDDIRVWYQNKAKDQKKAMTIRTREIVEELMDLIYTKQ